MSATSVRLLAETNFAWCADRYLHIWEGVQKLSVADCRLGIAVELGDVAAEIAAKKAHTYARRFGLKLMCKTRMGANGKQIFIRRRPGSIVDKPRSEAQSFKDLRIVLGYSSNCAENYHGDCRGFRNMSGMGRTDCHCPCHIEKPDESLIPEYATWDKSKLMIQQAIIRKALKQTGGNQCKAARLLKMHRNTLNRVMKATV